MQSRVSRFCTDVSLSVSDNLLVTMIGWYLLFSYCIGRLLHSVYVIDNVIVEVFCIFVRFYF